MSTSETQLYKFLLVPGEAMLDSMGLPFSDGTKCTECTEVWIQGLTNFKRVSMEHEERRAMRSYRFYSSENQILPVLDMGGPIKSGDYLIRSPIPGYFQKSSIQEFSSRPFGISKVTCDFNPQMVPVYRNKKIIKAVTEEFPVETTKNLRKYTLVKTWDDVHKRWVGKLEMSTVTTQEPVYENEYVYDDKGQIIDTLSVPKTETRIVLREEDEIDEQGQVVQEIIGETLEYQLQYVNGHGLFEPEYREGLYKMYYATVDVINYCF